MAVLTDPIRSALTRGRLAHLTTLNPDGSPHVTIVWIDVVEDEIVSGHMRMNRKLRNARHDPRVSVSMEIDGHNDLGLGNYLVVDGSAHVTEGGAAALLQRLAERYVGPGVRFPPGDEHPPGYILHVTPHHVRGVSPWTRGW